VLFRVVPLLSIDEIEETERIQETAPAPAQRVPLGPVTAQGPAQPAASSALPAGQAANGKSPWRWAVRRGTAAGLLVLAAMGLSLAAARPAVAAQAGPKPAGINITGTHHARGLHLTPTLHH